MRSKKVVWFVGGETGGHIVPLIAVARELSKHNDCAVQFIGGNHSIEQRLATQAGYRFTTIQSGKIRRSFDPMSVIFNLADSVKIVLGLASSWWYMYRQRPALVFSKGGPVAVPVALAAWTLGVPIVTHESDIVIGRSNQLIARLAETVLTGFPVGNYPNRYAQKLIHVGIPLRREFCVEKQIRRKQRPMVLVTCGSQGASSVGAIVLEILPRLLGRVDVMHICGAASSAQCRRAKDGLSNDVRDRYNFVAYTDAIADHMRQATLIVTRASSQLFEIASLGKACIVIPLAWAAQNHQVKNAEYFASRGAARILRQESLTPARLYETINSLLQDKQVRHQLELNIRMLASCEASKRVSDTLYRRLASHD